MRSEYLEGIMRDCDKNKTKQNKMLSTMESDLLRKRNSKTTLQWRNLS